MSIRIVLCEDCGTCWRHEDPRFDDPAWGPSDKGTAYLRVKCPAEDRWRSVAVLFPFHETITNSAEKSKPTDKRDASGGESGTPFVGFTADQLKDAPPLKAGDKIICPHCKEEHVVEGANPILLTYKCGEASFLAAIDGKSVIGTNAAVSGRL